MSRDSSRSEFFLSPVQRRACVVFACCVLALVLSVVFGWVLLPWVLNSGDDDAVYDPALYPVDTTLSSVLPSAPEAANYMTGTVFVGDQYVASMQSQGLISLNQYAGADGLTVGTLLRENCVNFANDANTYNIPQALAMMKPRRVVLTVGANDVSNGTHVDNFIMDYKQALSSLAAAYPYCDIIVNAIPPVTHGQERAATRQTLTDQYNQALAQMCSENNYKFLNSSEALKNASGYGEDLYFNESTGLFTAAGGNALLMYFRQHPYDTQDRRPDTNDIPQRAAQPGSSDANAEPSPTPEPIKLSYGVENSDMGQLSGNGQVGERLEFEVAEGTVLSVTAEAKEGYTFYKWSDGQTSMTRTDIISKDADGREILAMFQDARAGITMQASGPTTLAAGGTVTFTASVTLGGKPYTDTSFVQWTIDHEFQDTVGGAFTFTAPALTEGRDYRVAASVTINNGEPAEAVATVHVDPMPTPTPPPATAISGISGPNTVQVGGSITLAVTVSNPVGDTSWSCDGYDWRATGNSVAFTAPAAPGQYTVHATNNGATANYLITVTAAPTPAPTPEPTPDPAQTPPEEGG